MIRIIKAEQLTVNTAVELKGKFNYEEKTTKAPAEEKRHNSLKD